MEGLLKQERSRTFDADGWYHTGDRGYFRDGLLFFTGRSTEMIKTGGANVAPREVELAVESLPGVQAAFVVGVPDAARGQLVACLVCPEDGHEIDTDALRAALADVLSSFKIPRRFLVVPFADVPWLGTGKIDKPRIVEMFADRRRLTQDAVELALTQDTRRPVATAELAAAARAAGFTRARDGDGPLRVRTTAPCSTGPGCGATSCSGSRCAPTRRRRSRARSGWRSDAAAVGAPWVLTTFETPLAGRRARDGRALRGDLRRGRRRAGDRVQPARTGARHRGGIDAVAAAVGGRAGIVIDAWNFCFGPSTWEDLERVPLGSRRVRAVRRRARAARRGEHRTKR